MRTSGSFNIGFRRVFWGGYKPSDVDAFVDEVEAEILSLRQENSDLKSRVEKFSEEEESIRKAIVSAQKLADSAVSEAKLKAKKISTDANSSIECQKLELDKLRNEVKDFKKKIIENYRDKIRELEKDVDLTVNGDKNSERPRIIDQSVFDAKKSASINKSLEQDSNSNEGADDKKSTEFDEVFSEECSNNDGLNQAQEGNFETRELEFGENYSIEDKDESVGIFAGLFKNKKIR